MPQILATAAAVRVALADAGMDDVSSVHAVLVKGPALSAASAQRAVSRGKSVVTTDIASGKDNAMSFSNDASALGVALALGEVRADDLSDDVVRRDWELHSSVAIASAEANRSVADVVVLGNSASSASTLRIGHSTIRSLIDADGVAEALRSAGLPVDCRASEFERSRIVQIFAKLVVPDSEELGGGRLTIHGDPSLSRTAKVIGGVLVAAVTGMTRVFVSGGEQNSHQGPPGGSPVAAIVRAAETEA